MYRELISRSESYVLKKKCTQRMHIHYIYIMVPFFTHLLIKRVSLFLQSYIQMYPSLFAAGVMVSIRPSIPKAVPRALESGITVITDGTVATAFHGMRTASTVGYVGISI